MKSLALASLTLALLVAAGCGGARPYRAMAKAASSEENVFSQAEDHRLALRVREAILADDPSRVISVTPYAYMGHVYLVGFVSDAAEGARLESIANSVAGVRTLDTVPAGAFGVRVDDRRRGAEGEGEGRDGARARRGGAAHRDGGARRATSCSSAS
jgi:hypothetical protein